MWPVPGFTRVTSGFRTTERPNHNGIDIGRNISPYESIYGKEIVAVADGYVTIVQDNHESFGNWVQITHNPLLRTRYAHNLKNLVKHGQFVSQGDVIALVGSTGRSTAPHLHFEVIYDGQHQDPLQFLNPARKVPVGAAVEMPVISYLANHQAPGTGSSFFSRFIRRLLSRV